MCSFSTFAICYEKNELRFPFHIYSYDIKHIIYNTLLFEFGEKIKVNFIDKI